MLKVSFLYIILNENFLGLSFSRISLPDDFVFFMSHFIEAWSKRTL